MLFGVPQADTNAICELFHGTSYFDLVNSPPPVALSGVFPMRGGENIEYFLFHARLVIR